MVPFWDRTLDNDHDHDHEWMNPAIEEGISATATQIGNN